MAESNILTPRDDPYNAIANYFRGNELFIFRMEREDKLIAYREDVKKERTAGLSPKLAEKKCMARFGFVDVRTEREQYAEFKKLASRTKDKTGAAARQQNCRLNKKTLSIEQELELLPNSADETLEMEWVRSHPAMARSSLMLSRPGAQVVLKPEDVHEAPNGPCPSRTAWNMLAHWIDHPSEFHKQLLSEAKKSIQDARKEKKKQVAENAEDPTEIDISALLDSLNEPEPEPEPPKVQANPMTGLPLDAA